MKQRQRRKNTYPPINSSCGDIRIRAASAKQAADKYEQLASEENDPTMAENMRQHAEHYRRQFNEQQEERRYVIQD